MSILRKISLNICPDCGCNEIKKEEVHSLQHEKSPYIPKGMNGERLETRVFICGYAVEYNPKYDKEKAVDICMYHPRINQIKEKREKAAIEIFKFISRLPVDGMFKKHINNCIEGQENLAPLPKEAIIEGYLTEKEGEVK